MLYRNIYNASIKIPVLGQGVGDVEENFNKNDIIDILKVGIDYGMTLIDTAENYRNGQIECIIGEAIKEIREKIFISTKVSPENLSYNDVIQSAEKSLKRLNTHYIDLYQIHWPNPMIHIEETLSAMSKLLKDGKIRFIGVSNFSLEEFKEANNYLNNKIISNQIEYNLCDRNIEKDILPYAVKHNKLIIAYSPLSRLHKDKNKLQEIAMRYNKTIIQIILNWLMSRRNVIILIRSFNKNHIRENIAAMDFHLDYIDIEIIDDIYKDIMKKIYVKDIILDIDTKRDNNLRIDTLVSYIRKGKKIKPIKLKEENGAYRLIEGKFRCLSWRAAHGDNLPIDALIY